MNRHQLPARVNNNQSWIFITGESPVNFYYQNPSFYPEILDKYFDRSISYKYDSPFSIFSPILKSRLNPDERKLNFNSLKLKKNQLHGLYQIVLHFLNEKNMLKN